MSLTKLFFWAAIQRQGSILSWIVSLSVYGANTIAIDLPFCADLLIYEINCWILNNSNLHAIISTLLIINLHWVQKIYFPVLEEIYNNVVPHLSAVLISCNHSIPRIISFTKNCSKQRSIVSVYGPCSRGWHSTWQLLNMAAVPRGFCSTWLLLHVAAAPHVCCSTWLLLHMAAAAEGCVAPQSTSQLGNEGKEAISFMYRRPTLYPLEIAVDFLKSP